MPWPAEAAAVAAGSGRGLVRRFFGSPPTSFHPLIPWLPSSGSALGWTRHPLGRGHAECSTHDLPRRLRRPAPQRLSDVWWLATGCLSGAERTCQPAAGGDRPPDRSSDCCDFVRRQRWPLHSRPCPWRHDQCSRQALCLGCLRPRASGPDRVSWLSRSRFWLSGARLSGTDAAGMPAGCESQLWTGALRSGRRSGLASGEVGCRTSSGSPPGPRSCWSSSWKPAHSPSSCSFPRLCRCLWTPRTASSGE